MSSRDPEYELAVPLPEDDLSEEFKVAEELASWAEIDLAAEGWQAFKKLLGPLQTERPVTWQHSQRVATYALGLATVEGGWEDQRLLVYGGLAHDLGKLAVPQAIAENFENFETESEAEKRAKKAANRHHPDDGFAIIKQAGFPFTAAVAGAHHRYQASPYGIPLSEMADNLGLELTADDSAYLEDAVRLIALADHFDAMLTRSPNMFEAERRAELMKDFSLPTDTARIDWLEANQIA
ncbi:MAG TPA: HD domain-containing protein [Candidatus Saccharimonadales bacterium]|nr:HD domain-containing protein [Candidatus Saccharimonadales bacterium]